MSRQPLVIRQDNILATPNTYARIRAYAVGQDADDTAGWEIQLTASVSNFIELMGMNIDLQDEDVVVLDTYETLWPWEIDVHEEWDERQG